MHAQSDRPPEPSRRRLITHAAVAFAATVIGRPSAARADELVPYSSGTENPRLVAPPGAVDCHIHIYDGRYPAAPSATLHPPDASVADFARLQRRLGTRRVVVVQPSTYGTDNRCTLEAVERMGSTARAVAVVDASVSDAELKRMNSQGVRGIRFNLVQAGATTLEMIEPLAKRVADLGWHVQLHMKGERIAQVESLLAKLACPLVIDHLGRVPPASGLDHPGFAAVRRLLDGGNTYMKLSGAYHDSVSGAPAYADMAPIARAYAAAAPERMVWGSDWPHPTVPVASDKPDDAHLLDLLLDWVPDERARKRVLVDNPERLYGFAPMA